MTLSQAVSFRFAYTDPAKDTAVSRHLEEWKVMEESATKVDGRPNGRRVCIDLYRFHPHYPHGTLSAQIFYKIFDGRCIRADGSRELFVDVGANFGWFAVIAATMGCRYCEQGVRACMKLPEVVTAAPLS